MRGLFVAGTLLPAFTLAFELSTGMCASGLFDQLPTSLHSFLVALVAFGNGLAWHVLSRPR